MSLLIAAALMMDLVPTPPKIPPGAKVTPPEWLMKPSAEAIGTHYPPRARALGLSGAVVINCIVTPEGTLDPCEVLAEAPKGMGFGDAALAISHNFRMRPMKVDGKPVGGMVVRVPLSFANGSPPGWPSKAWAAKISGHVVLDCTLNEQLRPAECAPQTEEPAGYGFGDFAIYRVSMMRIAKGADGADLHPGDHVSIPVDFTRDGKVEPSSNGSAPHLRPSGSN